MAGVPGGAPGGLSPEEKIVQMALEHCGAKAVISGVAGGGMGAIFGLFMATTSLSDLDIDACVSAPTAWRGGRFGF